MSQLEQPTDQTRRIRELNDALRTAIDPTDAFSMNGTFVVTANLASKGPAFLARAVDAMRTFSDFNADNDPYGEHDCAVMQVDGETVVWKVDTYAPDLEHGSAAPWDAGVTRRVLTLMLGEDY